MPKLVQIYAKVEKQNLKLQAHLKCWKFKIPQANSENCGPPRGNKFDFEKVKGEGQGHGMVPIERACHKYHACQVSMLYHKYFRRYAPG